MFGQESGNLKVHTPRKSLTAAHGLVILCLSQTHNLSL
jgi:hypothetical protein